MEKKFKGSKFGTLGENSYNRTFICACLRKDLKDAFNKDWKFSVRKTSGQGIQVSILQMPRKAMEGEFNKWASFIYPENFTNGKDYIKLIDTAMAYNYDNSDGQTDYFDVNYYLTWNVSKVKYV